jgi:hypothetical protein
VGYIKYLLRSDWLKLLLITGLAYYVAFIPHQGYAYPLHLDEWTHLACSNEIITESSAVGLSSPFSGGERISNQLLEVGFQLFWAVFHQISGIPWLVIYRYFPGIILIFTTLSVYILARKEGFGWEAAFFTALIPTTVGLLGPAFMVPIALGLPFIPLSMFLVFNFRTWWSYLVLFVFIILLLTLYSGTVVGLAFVLIPYVIINLKRDFKHSLMITLVFAIPFVASLPWLFNTLVLPALRALLHPQFPYNYVDLGFVISLYGYLPTALCLLGAGVLTFRRTTKSYGLVLGLLALALMLSIFYTFHIGIQQLYYRGIIYLMLVMGIVAGAGLMVVRHLDLRALAGKYHIPSFISQNVGRVIALVLVGLTVFFGLSQLYDIPYYRMIDQTDYEAFMWIRDNIGGDYDKAILDPWKASAFTAISGKKIYSRIGEYPTTSDMEARDFLENGCIDTEFLRANGISIVYTQGDCLNPDLTRVREYIYLLSKY